MRMDFSAANERDAELTCEECAMLRHGLEHAALTLLLRKRLLNRAQYELCVAELDKSRKGGALRTDTS